MHELNFASVSIVAVFFFITGMLFDRFVLLPLAYLLPRIEDAIRSWLDGSPRPR